MRCEDFPCCGHGPPPLGDGGGCPDEEGRFNCAQCGAKLPAGNHSALCDSCLGALERRLGHEDCGGCPGCEREGCDDCDAALEDCECAEAQP